MRTEHFGYSPEDIGKNEDDYDYDRTNTPGPTPKQYTLMVLGVLALVLASFLIVVTYPAFVTCAGMGGVLGAIIFGVALIRISTTSNKIRG